jgi:hypothetical protein
MTTALQCIKTYIKTLGGRYDHYAKPPGHLNQFLSKLDKIYLCNIFSNKAYVHVAQAY